jgi:hypothetical protein
MNLEHTLCGRVERQAPIELRCCFSRWQVCKTCVRVHEHFRALLRRRIFAGWTVGDALLLASAQRS